LPPTFVGLTGGIGAGKSEALAALGRLGASVLSTDAIVHELYGDPDVVGAVVERWGDEVAPGGVVDRAAIARRAFGSSDDERTWLEGLLWPRVGDRMVAWREAEATREPPPPALVVEVPLLFEAGMEGAFDTTVAIVADEEVRAQRAGERGHEAIDERAVRQLTQQEKAELADHVVANSGTIEELEHSLSKLLEMLNESPA
jgi:dephospho-CoA kinase